MPQKKRNLFKREFGIDSDDLNHLELNIYGNLINFPEALIYKHFPNLTIVDKPVAYGEFLKLIDKKQEILKLFKVLSNFTLDYPRKVHYGTICEQCKDINITGDLYKCTTCTEYYLCTTCYYDVKVSAPKDLSNLHLSSHTYTKLTPP